MEKNINILQGEFGHSHVKRGIVVRKNTTRDFIGIIVESSRGYAIRTPMDEYIGGENSVNILIAKFSGSYSFYLL